MNKDIGYRNLNYAITSNGEKFEFTESEDPLVFLNDIKKGKISIQEAKNIQKEYNKYLSLYEEEIKIENKEKPLII